MKQQPDHWVAFSADVREIVGPNVSLGRFYRDSHGSTRNERRSPLDQAQTTITIDNHTDGSMYTRDPILGRWAVYRQSKPAKSGPPILRDDTRGLSSTPESDRIEGYEVFRIDSTKSGQFRLVAPDLNFFALMVCSSAEERTEYFNVVVSEVPPAMFLPPDGVPLRMATSLTDLFRLPAVKK